MKSANKKHDGQYADLGVLFDGSVEDDSADSDHMSEDLPAGREVESERGAHVPAKPEIIHPTKFRLMTEVDYRQGEDAWGYLNRITPFLLKELVGMALAPTSVVNAKTKLDALRELLQRPMPARQVVDINATKSISEFDRMSDEQVKAYIASHLGLPPPASTPTPEDDGSSGAAA